MEIKSSLSINMHYCSYEFHISTQNIITSKLRVDCIALQFWNATIYIWYTICFIKSAIYAIKWKYEKLRILFFQYFLWLVLPRDLSGSRKVSKYLGYVLVSRYLVSSPCLEACLDYDSSKVIDPRVLVNNIHNRIYIYIYIQAVNIKNLQSYHFRTKQILKQNNFEAFMGKPGWRIKIHSIDPQGAQAASSNYF